MPKALKDSLSIVQPGHQYINPPIVKCSECKKKFERLSSKWAYCFIKGGREILQCTWTCHRIAEARLFPRKALRGEYYAEAESERQQMYRERRKMTKLGNSTI